MIAFFPTPYPEESLYSLIARYHLISGNLYLQDSMYQLFGVPRTSSSIILPTRLGMLASQTERFGLNFDELLFNRSMFSYFMVFSKPEQFLVVHDHVKNNKSGPVRGIMGLHSSATLGKYLRFCPKCYVDETKEYGESYWHRHHQTPGVLVCLKHHCRLIESKISSTSNRRDDYFPMISTLSLENQLPDFSEKNCNLLLQVASDIEFLYKNANSIREQFLSRNRSFRQAYIALLQRNGIATETAYIRTEKFLTAFFEHFSPEILSLIGVPFDEEHCRQWIVSLCRNGPPPQEALKFILLAEFVAGSFREFIEKLEIIERSFYRAEPNRRPISSNYEEASLGYRNRWLAAKNLLPIGASKSEIANKDKAAYSWLNKNDKEWLNINSPKHKSNCVYERHFAWQERDLKYAEMVKEAVKALLDKPGVPERLTCASIGREMNCAGVLKAKPEHFPLTKEEINKYTESVHQYRLRKINRIKIEMTYVGEPIVPWQIVNKAGIKCKESRLYIEMLKRDI